MPASPALRPDQLHIEQVEPEITRPLRQRHLMQHRTLDQLAASDGQYLSAGYFVARTPDGDVVATASTRLESPPWEPTALDSWRIRGMVTIPSLRRQGVGFRLLEVVIAHAIAHGARSIWCHVRAPAIPFYERAGLRTIGTPWEDPDTGPHMAMWRSL
jgi:GNAT superfamily N-acetyltransferase